MEQWDLVKLYASAMGSGHFVEAICFGCQKLEYILDTLLINTSVGNDGESLDEAIVAQHDYLRSKAKLALDYEFLPKPIYDQIMDFSRLQADIIHNAAKKNIAAEGSAALCRNGGSVIWKDPTSFLGVEN